MPLVFVISIHLCRALLACCISTCGSMSVATLYSSDQCSYACWNFVLLCLLGIVLYICCSSLSVYCCLCVRKLRVLVSVACMYIENRIGLDPKWSLVHDPASYGQNLNEPRQGWADRGHGTIHMRVSKL